MAAVPGPPVGGLRGAIDLAPLVARKTQQAAQEARAPQQAGPDATEAPQSRVVIEVGDAEFPQLIELSRTVPIVVALIATWSTPSQELVVTLRRAVEAQAGRLVLAIVDADANPQVADAFQAQSIPTVVAVVGGAPVPLFAGVLPAEQMGPLLEQLLGLAAEHGVTGSVPDAETPVEGAAESAPEPLPPLHVEAYAAIDRQDYAEAARLFRTAIAQDPRDAAAPAALAQVELLDRVRAVPEDARARAAADPHDAVAALHVADLDMSGGHVEDAFGRLLDAFAAAGPDQRGPLRARLVDYFTLTGSDDPRVGTARRRLAALLY